MAGVLADRVPGTLLLIAHDREFLDRIVNRVVNIEHGSARAYRGNYSAFEEQRAAELAEQSGAVYPGSSSRSVTWSPLSSASARRRPRPARRKVG